MNVPSISLRRSIDLTMKDTLLRIKYLGGKDSKALIDEYREWLEASHGSDKHPYVLYIKEIGISGKNN
tara:strand:+ start:250 stop:453 length:204 start_codon:yes stop_codon:yes gene_type:complete